MGILAQDLNTLKKYHPNPKSMLELGNQYLYIFQNQKPFDEYPDKYLTNGNVVVAKEYFQELGIDHVSLDYTGNDGALKGDLDYPIDLKRTFDVITDFGTSEHCTNLYQALRIFNPWITVSNENIKLQTLIHTFNKLTKYNKILRLNKVKKFLLFLV